MKLYRTQGKTGKYILMDATTEKVVADALVFLPGMDEAGIRALEYLIEHADTDAVLSDWAMELSRSWREAKDSVPYEAGT